MSYNVVFEYDETLGGAYGTRFWTSYSNIKEFELLNKNLTGMTIIAKDVTDEKALDLTSLTPEICRLMHAVEEVYLENPDASMERMSHAMSMARYAIEHDRAHIYIHDLERIDASKYITAFKVMIASERTFKTVTMSVYMLSCLNQFGEVY